MTGVSNSWWERQTHRHSEEAKAEHLVKGPAAGVPVWQGLRETGGLRMGIPEGRKQLGLNGKKHPSG